MAPRFRWRDPEGVRTITQIVKNMIPQWKDGLYPWQLKLVVRILDGGDIFCCIATGGGKSALFGVPIIVLKEVARHPDLYPDLPVRLLPVGLVITPTKGLAANIVLELKKLNVPAFAYCHETVTEARIAGRNLVYEIRDCKTWNIICVDPEHLREKAWRQISAFDVFRANIVYGCADEAHLINTWGAEFRPQFRHIGAFFNGCLPSSISVMALSATVQPGAALNSICLSLGMSGDNFYLFRSSNERQNVQFIMEPLTHGVGGKIFPQLLAYLNSGRKTVIHCRTIDDVLRIFLYLWKSLPPGPHRLRRLKMYHSLRSVKENEDILRLLDEDPECQVIIATVAFANGLNAKSLLDSLSVGCADTVDQIVQEKGRVGRDPETAARGVVFYQPSSLTAAETQLAVASSSAKKTTSKRTKKPKLLEHAKVLLLTEKHCYNACLNRIYQNPPLEITTLDCIAAKRRYPCSLCAARNGISIDFPTPSLPRGITLPLFSHPLEVNSPAPLDKTLKLTKKEREEAESTLVRFGNTVYRAEHKLPVNRSRPKSAYFPSSILSSLLDNLLSLNSLAKLEGLVEPWHFSRDYRVRLYAVERQAACDSQGKKKATDWDGSEEEEEEESESESSFEEEIDEDRRSSPIPPAPKRSRRVLEEVTNTSRSPPTRALRKPAQRAVGKPVQRAPRKRLEKAIEVSQSYSNPYRTSRRRAAQN
ncbi:P-loop containing nucleoside triphosphate hydrolase protein [Mycena albidolilacea]|uniref:DNA 3'-5' helicase n=1 Tax=Mycena albidolilacea TaxID=1033008 RepID=A0AAD7EBW0_9AGAR|nr:P-loop containing nucleoside triphosphate hydrolase protein [Mycena albidolilacea]